MPPKILDATGYAAPTPVTDGRCVYAMFANGDVVAVDFAGQNCSARSLGIPTNSYGHAASLTLYRNRVIIQFDQALKKTESRDCWRSMRRPAKRFGNNPATSPICGRRRL